jgi:hypothetical protein
VECRFELYIPEYNRVTDHENSSEIFTDLRIELVLE